MSENKPKLQPTKPISEAEHKQSGSAASNALYRKMLKEMPILADEDEELYGQLHDAIFDQVKPQSFLDKISVMDITNKLFSEVRYRNAIVGLINGARRVRPFESEDEREFSAIKQYLPHLQKLQRMIDNNEAGRRSILKEFHRKASNRKGAPSIVPEDKDDD